MSDGSETKAHAAPRSQSDMISAFRLRAKRLRRAATFSLFMILVSMGAGLSLFLYAGRITASDIGYYSRELAASEADLLSRLGDATKDEPAKDPIQQQLDALTSSVRMLQSKVADVESQPQLAAWSTRDMIATTATRIGSVLILLFLVQILVTLYRYNIRASAFYDARADALQFIHGHDGMDITAIAELFTPTNVDFGKLPRSPADQAVELAKALVGKNLKQN